jgi:lipopolysaccharide exporter
VIGPDELQSENEIESDAAVRTLEGNTLEGKAARGLALAGGAFALQRVLVFVATLVLARVLVPGDFGLVAFALSVLNFVEVLADAGLSEAIVYREDAEDDRVSSTAFWIGVIGSVVLVALVWFGAPAVARFGGSETVPLVRVLAFDFVLASIGNVHEYRLRHSLQFGRLFVPTTAGALVTGVVSIVAALAGAGAWSLVAGILAGTAIRSLLLWVVCPFRPRFVIARQYLPSLFLFGSGMIAVGFLGEGAKNIDYLIVGAKLGTTALGFYYVAFRLPELVILGVVQIANDVLFPYYARVNDGAEGAGSDLGVRYLATLRLAAALVIPASAGMAALALPIVLALYGQEWRAAVTPMALIALWAALASLAAMPGAAFKALGKSWLLTATGVVQLAVLIPAVTLAASHGIAAVAGAQVVEKTISLAMLGAVTARVLRVPWYAAFRAAALPLLMSAVTFAVVFPVGRAFDPYVAIAVGVPLGVGCYATLLRALMPDVFRVCIAPLARFRPKSVVPPLLQESSRDGVLEGS